MLARWLEAAFYLDLVCTWILVITLLRNGLFRVYRFLFAYLLVDGCHDLSAVVLPNGTQTYFLVYLFAQAVKIVLAVFVVLELYQIALAEHPALARFGRDMVSYILGIAAIIAALGITFDASVPAKQSLILHRFNSFERTMDLWMLLFLLIIACFMAWFPIRLTRNSVLYIAGFVLYFSTRATGLLLTNLAPRLMVRIDAAMLSVAILCLITWTLALRQKGEETTVVIGHRWDPEAMDRLAGQLTAINSRLLRLSRR
jgi:hypothetical protein